MASTRTVSQWGVGMQFGVEVRGHLEQRRVGCLLGNACSLLALLANRQDLILGACSGTSPSLRSERV